MKKPVKKKKNTPKVSDKKTADETVFTPSLPPEVKREAKRKDQRDKEVVGDGEEFEIKEVPNKETEEVPSKKKVDVPDKKKEEVPIKKTEDVPSKKKEEVPNKKIEEIPAKEQGQGKSAPSTKSGGTKPGDKI
jgi:hypothetical protein